MAMVKLLLSRSKETFVKMRYDRKRPLQYLLFDFFLMRALMSHTNVLYVDVGGVF